MDIRMYTNTVKLLSRLADPSQKPAPIIPYTPQKPPYKGKAATKTPLVRSVPESEGVPSELLSRFVRALRDEKTIDMHSVTVLRRSHVICECFFGAYESDVRRVTHSMCKSVTSLAIGLMLDRGLISLDDRVTKLLERFTTPISALAHKNLTVRHLLTMSSGVMFNEAGSVTETEWIKSFFESVTKFDCGKEFDYNSMNTYMLAAIVKEITGSQVSEFLREPVFDVLGMSDIYWERSPEGIEKGGWGMYILPEDMAKLGILFMNGGEYDGHRVISEEYMRAAVTAQMKTPDAVGAFDYGYQAWTGKHTPSLLLNGMFGQNVLGYRDSDIIIVTTAGNEEVFQQSRYFNIAESFFGAGFMPSKAALPPSPAAAEELKKLCACHGAEPVLSDASLSSELPAPRAQRGLLHRFVERFTKAKTAAIPVQAQVKTLPDECKGLSGSSFIISSKQILGLLPLMVQSVQNNYCDGITGLSFLIENGVFKVRFSDALREYEVPVGFGGEAEYTELDFSGEVYRIGTTGRFAENEDGVKCLVLKLFFVEIPNTRIVKLFFEDDKTIRARFTEKPDIDFVSKGIDAFLSDIPGKKIIDALSQKLDDGYLIYRVKAAFEREARFDRKL